MAYCFTAKLCFAAIMCRSVTNCFDGRREIAFAISLRLRRLRSGMEDAMKDEDYNIPEDQDYTSAASAFDCTGLVPSGTGKPEELAAYKELYPFGQPVLSDKEAAAMRAKNRRREQTERTGREGGR